MKATHDQEGVSITRGELLALTVASILGGGALSGLLAFALQRFGHVDPPIAYAATFVVLGISLFVPLKLRKRSAGVHLSFVRFLGACCAGAVVVGLVMHLLR